MIIANSCSQQLKICHYLESHFCMLLGHVVDWKEQVFVSSSTVITGLVEFAHRTKDKSNITAFESLKLGRGMRWKCIWHQLETWTIRGALNSLMCQRIIWLRQQSPSYIHNFWFIPTLHELVGIKDGCKVNVCRKLSTSTFAWPFPMLHQLGCYNIEPLWPANP